MTMTTTEPRTLGALEGRLYIIAVLAAVYVATWRVLDRPAPVAEREARPARPHAVWLDDLPAEQRRTITAPPGWAIASRGATAPQVVRVPVKRPRRVRTRSS
jgi:hypothetical protein